MRYIDVLTAAVVFPLVLWWAESVWRLLRSINARLAWTDEDRRRYAEQQQQWAEYEHQKKLAAAQKKLKL